ncbi:hypothetical protein [Angelakisella massiliensis]|nr:hypothetical protein [Angelakisella massiliensis]
MEGASSLNKNFFDLMSHFVGFMIDSLLQSIVKNGKIRNKFSPLWSIDKKEENHPEGGSYGASNGFDCGFRRSV